MGIISRSMPREKLQFLLSRTDKDEKQKYEGLNIFLEAQEAVTYSS